MEKKPVSRADFARLTGKSRAAITKLAKGKLAPAMVGDRIDIAHPVAAAYLAANRSGAREPAATSPETDRAPTKAKKQRPAVARAPTKGASPKRKPPGRPPAPRPESEETDWGDEVPEGSDEEVAELIATLTPLAKRFGTKRFFRDWLLALKDLEIIREKRLANAREEGLLIERARVQTHLLGIIESGNKRLLGDAPKTIASRNLAMAKSGASLEEVEKFVRDTMSSILTPVRDAVIRNLRRKKQRRRPTDAPPGDKTTE